MNPHDVVALAIELTTAAKTLPLDEATVYVCDRVSALSHKDTAELAGALIHLAKHVEPWVLQASAIRNELMG